MTVSKTCHAVALGLALCACGPQEEPQEVTDLSPPIVEITSGPYADLDGAYTLTGRATDDVGVLYLGVKVGDENPTLIDVAEDGTFSASLYVPRGPVSVVAQAQDASGKVTSAVVSVRQGSESTELEALYDVETPFAGEVVYLDASVGENPGGEDLTYTWSIEDGGDPIETTEPRLRWVFRESKSYVIVLDVESASGETDSYRSRVVVLAPTIQGTRMIRGLVRDAEGRLLEDASVSIVRAPYGRGELTEGIEIASTDARGAFAVEVPAGVPYVLEIRHGESAPGYVRVRRNTVARASHVEIALANVSAFTYADEDGVFGSTIGASLEPVEGGLAPSEEGGAVAAVEFARGASGEHQAFDDQGRLVELHAIGQVWFRVHGAEPPSPEAPATLEFDAPDAERASGALALWHYDLDEGRWVARGLAEVTDGARATARASVDAQGWWMVTPTPKEPLSITLDGASAHGSRPVSVEVEGASPEGLRAVDARVSEVDDPTLELPWAGDEAIVEAFAPGAGVLLHASEVVPAGGERARSLALAPLAFDADVITSTSPLDETASLDLGADAFYQARTRSAREVLELVTSGADAQVIIRNGATGRPVARFRADQEGAYTFAPNAAGSWIVQLRHTERADVRLNVAVVEGVPRLVQGAPLGAQVMTDDAPKCYGIWARRGQHVGGFVTDLNRDGAWEVELRDLEQNTLGVVASSEGVLAPIVTQESAELLLCVRETDPERPLSVFTMLWSDVHRSASLAAGTPRTRPHAVPQPGSIALFPFTIPAERFYRLGVRRSTPSTPLPFASITGDVSPAERLGQRDTIRTLGASGADAVVGTLAVTTDAEGDATVEFDHSAPGMAFLAGDPQECEGANGALELGVLAAARNDRISLCPGLHYLDTALTKHVSLLGDEERGSTIVTPKGVGMVDWVDARFSQLEFSHLRHDSDSLAVPVISVQGLSTALIIEHVEFNALTRSQSSAIDVSGDGSQDSYLGVRDIEVNEINPDSVVTYARGVVAEDVRFVVFEESSVLRAREVGLEVKGAVELVTVANSEFDGFIKQHAVVLDVAGGVTLTGNRFETTSALATNDDLVQVTLREATGLESGLRAVQNTFTLRSTRNGLRSGLFVEVDQEGADVVVERNVFERDGGQFFWSLRDGLLVYPSRSLTALGELIVRANVFLTPGGPSELERLELFTSVTLTHNSATFDFIMDGPMFDLETGLGTALVTFANNAIEYLSPTPNYDVSALRSYSNVTVTGGHNIYSEASPEHYIGIQTTPLPGDDVQPTSWDQATLEPSLSSALVDAGLDLQDPDSIPINGGDRARGGGPDVGAWER